MEDTQGNQKPHKNSTQGLGVEIFYKPSRNAVPAEYIGQNEEVRDWYYVLCSELHSGDKVYIGLK